MTTVLLSLGSNVQPRRYLHAAVAALRERFGALRVSPAYRTAAVGFDGPAFLNNAVAIETDLPLQELDDWLHALEDAHGRDRSGPRFSDRTLDIDVVFYGDLVVEGPGHLRSAPGAEACLRAEAAGRHCAGLHRPGQRAGPGYAVAWAHAVWRGVRGG
uniref:2-amino-4-hydroxy-6-hydroxymethyldihydropteridine diphosphokinase n=1 Tax=Panagrolaimus superbus TaxID=310955 RepID=A0A914YN29_9BILA